MFRNQQSSLSQNNLSKLISCLLRSESTQSFTLWQQSIIEFTRVVTISKYNQLTTSIIRGHSPRPRCYVCSRHLCMDAVRSAHPIRGELRIQHREYRHIEIDVYGSERRANQPWHACSSSLPA